jgi:hypothetical protein
MGQAIGACEERGVIAADAFVAGELRGFGVCRDGFGVEAKRAAEMSELSPLARRCGV